MVRSIISRRLPAAIRSVPPWGASVPSGSCGKSFTSRLTILNFERPDSTSTQPAWLDLRTTSSPGTSREEAVLRSEEHTSEHQSPYVISYAVFCLKKKKITRPKIQLSSCTCASSYRGTAPCL